MSTTRRSTPSRRADRPEVPATRAGEERGRGGSPRRAPGSAPRPARSTGSGTARATPARSRTSKTAATRAPAAGRSRSTTTSPSRAKSTSTRSTKASSSEPSTSTRTRSRSGAGTARTTSAPASRSKAKAPTRTSPRTSPKAPTRTTRPKKTAPAGRSRTTTRSRPPAPPVPDTRGRGGGGGPRGRGWRSGEPHKRAIGLLGLLIGLFAIVALRLVMVQVVGADRYVEYGKSQRSLDPIVLPAGRGSVFDRNGFDLALSIPQRTIWADPRLITNPAATARRLSPVIFADVNDLREKLSRDAAFVYVARQVSDQVAEEVEGLDLDGIFSIEEPKRINPSDALGRSVIGAADVDNVGMSGLELQYDDTLTGEPGEMVLERDRNGRTIPAGRHHVVPATPGEDLVLTLDRNLQAEAERILTDQVAERQARGGSAVISDPETGDILALVNVTVDAETGQPRLDGNNRAVTANYEPGSVNKVITMAAAIEEGLVVPETELTVPDALQVADHEFTDSHDHPTETMSVMDILTDSSNIGTILVAQEVGKERLYDYLRDFGFGDATALDFPAEVSGSIRAPGDWSGTDIGAIPIGQGISVTAMQMLYAYNAIANDGVYVPPKLVDEVIDADGDRRPAPSDQPHRVVSPDTARQVRQMLANVVDAGTGEAAAIDGYDVAGKTGTARKPAPDGGYRWEDGRYHYISTFAGFMPADDPKLSVIVVLDEPRSVFASSTAAPAFGELSRQALRLLDLPPVAGGDEPAISIDPPASRGQAAPFPTTTTTAPPPAEPPDAADLIAALPPDDAAAALRAIRAATSMARPPRLDPDRQG